MNNNLSINLFECLGIVFIILKLCKVINWSWLWGIKSNMDTNLTLFNNVYYFKNKFIGG